MTLHVNVIAIITFKVLFHHYFRPTQMNCISFISPLSLTYTHSFVRSLARSLGKECEMCSLKRFSSSHQSFSLLLCDSYSINSNPIRATNCLFKVTKRSEEKKAILPHLEISTAREKRIKHKKSRRRDIIRLDNFIFIF